MGMSSRLKDRVRCQRLGRDGGAGIWILVLAVIAFCLVLLLVGGMVSFSSKQVSPGAPSAPGAKEGLSSEGGAEGVSAGIATVGPGEAGSVTGSAEGGGVRGSGPGSGPGAGAAAVVSGDSAAGGLAARPASPFTQQLVAGLVQSVQEGAGSSAERAAGWKAQWRQLVEQGPEAIPAIREFLARNEDFDWSGGKGVLGYDSARGAMFGALAEIGGPEAVGLLSEVLRGAADPREIATVARTLEQLEPGVHRQEAVAAAADTLNLAREGRLPEQDVAPLFEVLNRYGDASVVAELEGHARNWNYYSMMALAELPDGAGIPSLVRIATGENTGAGAARESALQMLAQTAAQSDAARQALVGLAREGKLSAYSWASIGPYLAGDRVQFSAAAFGVPQNEAVVSEMRSTHVSTGNQNFYSAPPSGGLRPEQARHYLALVEELLGATKDAAGVESLNRAKELIARRMAAGGPVEGLEK